jgi:serine/threonine-protein kinase
LSGTGGTGFGGVAPEHWARLRGLLDEALDLEPAARAGWLDTLAVRDTSVAPLLPRLRELLALAARRDLASVIDTLPKVETGDFATAPVAAPPTQIGPYRLLRELGSGGMASVWLAERTDMLQGRQVALKLPHGAWRRAGLAERMQREREILATLEHPHIARLYDAGVTDEAQGGQPWLALEYVQGERIDRWCEQNRPALEARLHLFLQAARAVAHAHARLVVHRDLKPANILVTTPAGAPEVRLLDFGIAKLLDQGVAESTELTQQHGRALTPDHASPEQLLGQPIGTASDVYSLGVVLYELLTGRWPYRLSPTERGARALVEQAVLTQEPRRASEAAPDAATARALQGDLDTIVGKALKKDPAERYATVDALAEDVRRHLEREPVLARPDSLAYRTRRFVARHRVAASAGGLVLLALVGGSALALWQARVALDEARRAEQVKAFVVGMFEGVDPDRAGAARDVTAAQVLASAEQRLAELPEAAPLVKAELAAALARSHLGLLASERAIAVATPALELPVVREASAAHPVRAELTLVRARALRQLQKLDEAEAALAPLLATLRAGEDGAPPQAAAEARLVQGTIEMHRGRFDEAAVWFTRILAMPATPALADMHIEAHEQLANTRTVQRDRAGALEHARAAYEGRLAQHPEQRTHPQVMTSGQVYGLALMELGRFDEAHPILVQSLDAARKLYGGQGPFVVDYTTRLALVEGERGQLKRALALLQEAEALAERAGLPDSLSRAGQLRTLARAHLRQREFAAALAPLDRSLAMLAQRSNPAIERVVQADRLYAGAFGMPLPAVGSAVAALERLTAAQAAGDARHRTHHPLHYLGHLQRLLDRPREALTTLELALPVARANPRRIDTAEALAEAALAALDAGDTPSAAIATHAANAANTTSAPNATSAPSAANAARAAKWLDEATALLAQARAEPLPASADIALGRARIALAAGRGDQALAAAREADAYWRSQAPASRDAGVAALWLARCLAATGQRAAAKAAFERAAPLLAGSAFPADARLRAAAERAQ